MPASKRPSSAMPASTACTPSRRPTTSSSRSSWPSRRPARWRLSTSLAIAFPRSPMHVAHQSWDLQMLSEGRFRLGLGTQVRQV
ncbi:MAG: LLM class flavin-dependent oxidoreductase, partial [Acidimicrobiia bacterium]